MPKESDRVRLAGNIYHHSSIYQPSMRDYSRRGLINIERLDGPSKVLPIIQGAKAVAAWSADVGGVNTVR